MPVDQRGALEDDPFDYRVAKDGRVLTSRGNRQVVIERHLDLARVTGNDKRGNERR